ncbi:family 43 glycosylhydrolase [Algoriphagus litoralis]|uniref:family 43 glycosylhydrolase n=1 Tax=Algoriphagus litoralis TaxID=2202829 RepID=UPI000DBA08E9|nr:family 43 glycosylhydrolase [Algoriphagus litoralis]
MPSYLIFLFSFFADFTAPKINSDAFFEIQDTDTTRYQNPVFEPVLADPTLIRHGEFFYAYGTEDNWGEEGGYHLVPVIRSKDLIKWDLVGDGFDKKPNWKQKGGIWAPDVTEVEGKFVMYYSFSTWGDPNPGIGVAISDTPEGPFEDLGAVFDSEEIGVKNSIDPFYWEEDNKKFLIWGSFHGLFLIELDETGRKPRGTKTQIAGNHLEAPYIHFREGYYYLFGSAGTCCEGEKSTYRILVGRSKSLLGPYFDAKGNDLMDGKSGELLLRGNTGETGIAGPGHNAELITDSAGQDWILYHGMQLEKPKLANGTNRRALFLDPLIWENGWPLVKRQLPGIKPQARPQFDSID